MAGREFLDDFSSLVHGVGANDGPRATGAWCLTHNAARGWSLSACPLRRQLPDLSAKHSSFFITGSAYRAAAPRTPWGRLCGATLPMTACDLQLLLADREPSVAIWLKRFVEMGS